MPTVWGECLQFGEPKAYSSGRKPTLWGASGLQFGVMPTFWGMPTVWGVI
ncbi:MAG: hypothetical protein ACQESF_02580 [Nanobdellota archaeon]